MIGLGPQNRKWAMNPGNIANVANVGHLLLLVNSRLAVREEREVRVQLGGVWDDYAARVPRFVSRLHPAAVEPGAPLGGRR